MTTPLWWETHKKCYNPSKCHDNKTVMKFFVMAQTATNENCIVQICIENVTFILNMKKEGRKGR